MRTCLLAPLFVPLLQVWDSYEGVRAYLVERRATAEVRLEGPPFEEILASEANQVDSAAFTSTITLVCLQEGRGGEGGLRPCAAICRMRVRLHNLVRCTCVLGGGLRPCAAICRMRVRLHSIVQCTCVLGADKRMRCLVRRAAVACLRCSWLALPRLDVQGPVLVCFQRRKRS